MDFGFRILNTKFEVWGLGLGLGVDRVQGFGFADNSRKGCVRVGSFQGRAGVGVEVGLKGFSSGRGEQGRGGRGDSQFGGWGLVGVWG